MKKIILATAGLALMLVSCNNQPEFDGLQEYTPSNLAKFQLTFDGTYTGSNSFKVGEDNPDDPEAVAKVKIEEWLNKKYYSVEKGSEATVKYNVAKASWTEVAGIGADFERAIVDGAVTQAAGWISFTEVGSTGDGSTWMDKSYDDNVFTQCGKVTEDAKVWFISPVLKVVKGDKLSWDVCVGNYVGDVLSVLISKEYSGAASSTNLNKGKWIDVTDRFTIPQEPTKGYGEFVNAGVLDLSEYAGKNIYIAFKYSGNATVNTVIRLDNIKVEREGKIVVEKEARAVVDNDESQWTVTLPSAVAEVVLEEGFESGKGYDKVALEGWLNTQVQGTNSWEYRMYDSNLYANLSANKHEGVLETWLVTPLLELAQDMVLNFDMKLGYYNGDALGIMVSEDFDGEPGSIGAATWTDYVSGLTIDKSAVAGYDSKWTNYTVDLAAHTGKNIYLAFKYLGNGTKGADLCSTTYQIDNIYVGIPK